MNFANFSFQEKMNYWKTIEANKEEAFRRVSLPRKENIKESPPMIAMGSVELVDEAVEKEERMIEVQEKFVDGEEKLVDEVVDGEEKLVEGEDNKIEKEDHKVDEVVKKEERLVDGEDHKVDEIVEGEDIKIEGEEKFVDEVVEKEDNKLEGEENEIYGEESLIEINIREESLDLDLHHESSLGRDDSSSKSKSGVLFDKKDSSIKDKTNGVESELIMLEDNNLYSAEDIVPCRVINTFSEGKEHYEEIISPPLGLLECLTDDPDFKVDGKTPCIRSHDNSYFKCLEDEHQEEIEDVYKENTMGDNILGGNIAIYGNSWTDKLKRVVRRIMSSCMCSTVSP